VSGKDPVITRLQESRRMPYGHVADSWAPTQTLKRNRDQGLTRACHGWNHQPPITLPPLSPETHLGPRQHQHGPWFPRRYA